MGSLIQLRFQPPLLSYYSKSSIVLSLTHQSFHHCHHMQALPLWQVQENAKIWRFVSLEVGVLLAPLLVFVLLMGCKRVTFQSRRGKCAWKEYCIKGRGMGMQTQRGGGGLFLPSSFLAVENCCFPLRRLHHHYPLSNGAQRLQQSHIE